MSRRVFSYLFSLYAVIAALICNLGTAPFLLVVPGADRRRRIARAGTYCFFVLTGIKLSVRGRDKLPRGHCIVVANHRSYFDGLTLISALPPGFSPVIKQSVADVPVLGLLMRRAGSVYIRRTPAHAAGIDTLRLIRRTRAGISPAMFAEGTLSPDKGLLPFREGAFLLAARTGLPVVPVALEGTAGVLPSEGRRLRYGRARVTVGDPIWPQCTDRRATVALGAATEAGVWRMLSPATADWRAHLPTEAYYARATQQCRRPFGVLDIDELNRRTQTVLGPLPAKTLRLDMRALAFGAVARRLVRSDVRVAGLLCADVDSAVEWIERWLFSDAIVIVDEADSAMLGRAGRAIAAGCRLALAAANAQSLAAIERAAAAANCGSVAIRLHARVDGRIGAEAAENACVRELQAMIECCRHSTRLDFAGTVIEPETADPAPATARAIGAATRAAARLSAAADGAVAPISVGAHGADTTSHRTRSVSELIVGPELLDEAQSTTSSGYPLAAFCPASDGPVQPLSPSALHARRVVTHLLYGGAVIDTCPAAAVANNRTEAPAPPPADALRHV